MLRKTLSSCVLIAGSLAATSAIAAENWPRVCDWQADASSCFHGFSEGLALTPTGPMGGSPVYGYIDHSGDMAIDPRFTEARSFANGLAAVKLDGAWGYIRKSGEIAIAPRFEEAHDFNRAGVAIVEDGETVSLIDRSGMVVKQFPAGASYIPPSNQAALTVTPLEAQLPPLVWHGASGRAVDLPDGAMRVEPAPFVEDGFFVQMRESRYTGRWGLFGIDGDWIKAPDFFETERLPRSDGRAYGVERKDGWRIVDSGGKPLVQEKYRSLDIVAHGVWLATGEDGEKTLLSSDGDIAAQMGSDARRMNPNDMPAYFQTANGIAVIGSDGGILTRDIAGFAYVREAAGHFWLYGEQNDLLQIITRDGTALLSDETLETLGGFSISPIASAGTKTPIATLRPADYEDAPAVLTRDGEIVSRPEWDDIVASYGSEGPLNVLAEDHRYGVIDGNGDWLVEPIYSELGPFEGDYALARKDREGDGLIVGIDGTEYPVRRAVFRGRGSISDGIMTYAVRDPQTGGRRMGLWNIAESLAVGDPSFAEVGTFENGFAPARTIDETGSGGLWGVIARDGAWVIEPRYEGYPEPERLPSGLYLLAEGSGDARRYALADPLRGEIVADGMREKPEPMAGDAFLAHPEEGGAILIDEHGEAVLSTDRNPRDVTVTQGLAVLTFDAGEGAVDAKGEWVVEPRYIQPLRFVLPQNVARVYDGEHTDFVLASGERLPLETEDTLPIPGMDRFARTLDREGLTVLIDARSTEYRRIKGRYGLIEEAAGGGYVPYRDDDIGKLGLMNADGEKVIGPYFETLGPVSEGAAFFQRQDISGRFFGFLGAEDGEIVLPAAYLAVKPFKEGVALTVDRQGGLAFVARDGKTRIDFVAECGDIVVRDATGSRSWPATSPCDAEADEEPDTEGETR